MARIDEEASSRGRWSIDAGGDVLLTLRDTTGTERAVHKRFAPGQNGDMAKQKGPVLRSWAFH